MARTIEIEDEERFQKLINKHESLGDDVQSRVLDLMGLGDLKISQNPYTPNKRHDDCLFALEYALESKHDFDNPPQLDVLYACVPVALSQPDEVAKALMESKKGTNAKNELI